MVYETGCSICGGDLIPERFIKPPICYKCFKTVKDNVDEKCKDITD